MSDATGPRRGEEEDGRADEIDLDRSEIRLTPAREILRRQRARPQQQAHRPQGLESAAEARQLVRQIADDAAGREIFRPNPPLTACRAVLA